MASLLRLPNLQHSKSGWHRSASQPDVCLYAGSYEGPIVSFPSDAAGQAEAVRNAAATPRARPLSRLANVSHTLLALCPSLFAFCVSTCSIGSFASRFAASTT